MGLNDQEQEQKQREIPALLEQIEKALQMQSEQITNLMERVNPLMYEEPKTASPPESKMEGCKTEISTRLQSYLIQIRNTTQRINKMLDCLEI